jgi:hypothetical protein
MKLYLSDLQLKDVVTLYITSKERRGSKQMVARWILVADFEYKEVTHINTNEPDASFYTSVSKTL